MDYLNAKGWLTRLEREWLYALAQDVVSGSWIINIGIEYGASLVCLHEGCKTARLVGIDLIGDSLLAESVPDLIVIKGNSNLIGEAWSDASLIFVDGGHDYSTVLSDATFWTPCLCDGGRIAFHDCFNSPVAKEVNEAVERWHAISFEHYQELQVIDSIRTFERISKNKYD